jgi:hypothetical protein
MSKEQRSKQQKNSDPSIEGLSFDQFFNNALTIPSALKDVIKNEGKDFRFINSTQFAISGNMHKTYWTPYQVPEQFRQLADVNGVIRRGDLVLAVRDKNVTSQYRKLVNQRNAANKGVNKMHAKELRAMARDAGVEGGVKISEGYEEN